VQRGLPLLWKEFRVSGAPLETDGGVALLAAAIIGLFRPPVSDNRRSRNLVGKCHFAQSYKFTSGRRPHCALNRDRCGHRQRASRISKTPGSSCGPFGFVSNGGSITARGALY
jgi:hypothetical protein